MAGKGSHVSNLSIGQGFLLPSVIVLHNAVGRFQVFFQLIGWSRPYSLRRIEHCTEYDCGHRNAERQRVRNEKQYNRGHCRPEKTVLSLQEVKDPFCVLVGIQGQANKGRQGQFMDVPEDIQMVEVEHHERGEHSQRVAPAEAAAPCHAQIKLEHGRTLALV